MGCLLPGERNKGNLDQRGAQPVSKPPKEMIQFTKNFRRSLSAIREAECGMNDPLK